MLDKLYSKGWKEVFVTVALSAARKLGVKVDTCGMWDMVDSLGFLPITPPLIEIHCVLVRDRLRGRLHQNSTYAIFCQPFY